jgi:hypothetical protein
VPITPESYLGAGKAERFANGPIVPGVHDYGPLPARPLPLSRLRYAGRWRIGANSATAQRGARLELSFRARSVFLVLGSPTRKRSVRVLLDGKPLAPGLSGADVHHGVATIGFQRLYRLVRLPTVQRHSLTLELAPGTAAYAFTFG